VPLPPDERRTRDETLRRLEALERRLSPGPARVPVFETWSQTGALVVQTSGRYHPPRGGRLVSVISSLAVGGSTPTVVEVWKSGEASPIETVTFGVDQTWEPIACSHFVDDSAYVWMDLVTAGSGARSITVQIEIIPGQ